VLSFQPGKAAPAAWHKMNTEGTKIFSDFFALGLEIWKQIVYNNENLSSWVFSRRKGDTS